VPGDPPPGPELTRSEAGDAAAARDFRLTMNHVRRYADANERIHARAAADPAFRARIAGMDEAQAAESMDEMIRQLEAVPEVRREIERAGLSAREFVLTMLSISAAVVHLMMRELGQEPELSEWLSERNLAFYEQNAEEIGGILERLQELGAEFEDDEW
jgi:hypothetical protein